MMDLAAHVPAATGTTIPRLAVELTDMIIDYLWDDPRTLHACALAGRAWLDASQHHLFRSIRLVGVGSSSQHGLDAFLQFLERTPRVRGYVRALDITGNKRHSTRHHVRSACLHSQHIEALATLPFLRRLTLTSVVWDREDHGDYGDGGGAAGAHSALRSFATRKETGSASSPRSTLQALTLSHFTSFGRGFAMLEDVLALMTPFAGISHLRLLRTNIQLDPTRALNPDVWRNDEAESPLSRLESTTCLQSLSLGPVSRASRLYTALTHLWCCSTIQRLKIQLGDWAQLADVARFMRSTAHNLTYLELDVSSCDGPWLDMNAEAEHLLDGIDWFADLARASDVPMISFRLYTRCDPPAVFWSMLLSAAAAMPNSVQDISIVATDVVPNGFNELVRVAQWQRLAEVLCTLQCLKSFSLTFAGMDDYRLARPARAAFSDNFNASLRAREALFSKLRVSVTFSFASDSEVLAR